MSYPPPAPRTSFQGHRVEGNMKVDDVHANIFQGHRVSGFGLELDGGKAWRRRLPGASEGGYEHRIGARILFYFYRDSEGAFGRESATRASRRPVACAVSAVSHTAWLVNRCLACHCARLASFRSWGG